MQVYDYILVYEHKVRELEALCLLKYELEKRGYSVFLIQTSDRDMSQYVSMKHKYHCKVLAVPACYNNTTFQMCVGRVISFEKVIDLQWEQLISKSQERENSYRNFSEIGKDVVHISWGKANERRLVERAEIEKRNIYLCGNMALDLLRDEFSSLYMSREEIIQKYGFSQYGKINVLFASFRGADCPDVILESYRKRYGEKRVQLQRLGKRTRDELLSWFCMAAKKYKNDTFIYRPHPGENIEYIQDKIKGIENIYIIWDFSARQWIMVADHLFSWHSTVLIEAFYAGKTAYSLDPFGYIDDEDAIAFEDMHVLRDYSELIRVLDGENINNNLNTQKVEDYFGRRDEAYSYMRVADAFESVYNENVYDLKDVVEKYDIYNTKNNSIKEKIYFNPFVNWVYWRYLSLVSKFKVMRKRENVNWYIHMMENCKKEKVSVEEISQIEKKIRKILSN